MPRLHSEINQMLSNPCSKPWPLTLLFLEKYSLRMRIVTYDKIFYIQSLVCSM